jgi:hypothetical protein
MTPQAVGAYGEKVVEAALLRLGWIPSNVNASVKNAARFDIVAQGPNEHPNAGGYGCQRDQPVMRALWSSVIGSALIPASQD